MAQVGRRDQPLRTQIRARMAGHWPEAIALALIVLVAGFLRLYDLQSFADWDSDQGGVMLA
jgi:hypothetical protein